MSSSKKENLETVKIEVTVRFVIPFLIFSTLEPKGIYVTNIFGKSRAGVVLEISDDGSVCVENVAALSYAGYEI